MVFLNNYFANEKLLKLKILNKNKKIYKKQLNAIENKKLLFVHEDSKNRKTILIKKEILSNFMSLVSKMDRLDGTNRWMDGRMKE